jgi:RNA 2',3'-cyclic 3'-phosphodiesterase
MGTLMAKERLKSPRLRLFVALNLPDEFLDGLVAWQEEAFADRRDLRVLSRYSLHITLVFLGYQTEKDIDRIAELSFAEPSSRFSMRAEDIVEVPPRRPRLYAIGMEDKDEALGKFQAGIAERLQKAGLYEPEKRPFWPHLTIARFKQTERHRTAGGPRGRPDRVSGGSSEPAGPPPEFPDELREPFEAARLTLYKSTLKPQGAEYDPLAKMDLGAKAPASSDT